MTFKDTNWMMVGVALLATACFGGGGSDGEPTSADRDGDGLTDVEEAFLGSNPDDVDTDRDTWDDFVEVQNNTDPLNGWDHPYTGGWAIDDCRNDIDGDEGRVGSVAPNFSLMDQHRDPVRLHDFCDRAVVVVGAAEWCRPCQLEAPFLQAMYEKYADDGLMVVTLLGEDVNNRTPTVEVLNRWVDEFELTYPVLQDTTFTELAEYTGPSGVLPANQLLGRGAVVQATNIYELTEEDIVNLLQLD